MNAMPCITLLSNKVLANINKDVLLCITLLHFPDIPNDLNQVFTAHNTVVVYDYQSSLTEGCKILKFSGSLC